ncbi:MAG: AFG1/ZapE family ATPase [Planctomycetota bacterium]
MPQTDVTALAADLMKPVLPQDLAPPPRFSDCSFDSYRVDPRFPGQDEAIAAVRQFAARKPRRFWRLGTRLRPGLYLAGDFGVGKTHLLAAAYHTAPGSRRWLGFAEAISAIIGLGPRLATDLIAADLVCIDEFELDDPSNTRLADLLLAELIRRGSRVLVTSNTVPGELGAGRFPVEDFKRQLQRIATRFADVHVPGEDFRRQQRGAAIDPTRWGPAAVPAIIRSDDLVLDAHMLDRLLARVPVINLRRLAGMLRRLVVRDLTPFPDQFSALRFVHLVDRLYDHRIPLHVQTSTPIDEIFLPDYRDWAFAKKYRRCTSRLHECCSGPREEAA